VWVATAPPVGLTIDKEPLDDLWSSVQDNLHTLGDQLGEGMHALQDSLHMKALELRSALQQSLRSFSANLEVRVVSLQEKMQGMQSQVKGQLEVAQHGLHENLVSLMDYLSFSVQTLEERIRALQEHLGAMAESLKDKLGTVGEHLNSSYQGLQGNLHALQDSLTENVGGVRERMAVNLGSLGQRIRGSCTNFQESLHVLQELLGPGPHNLRRTSSNVWSIVRWPLFVYMAGAMVCMLLSSGCHLFACMSKDISSIVWRFDYAGIAVLIVSSFFPPVYYGFMCKPIWKLLYLIPISLLGVSLTVFSTVTAFQSRKFRTVRAGLFALLGLFGAVPLCHQWLINSHHPEVRTVILYEVIMGALYLAGAAFFVLRIPERFKPGAFDVFFHSHQFFHVLVVLAAYVHFHAVIQLMGWRNANACEEPSLDAM